MKQNIFPPLPEDVLIEMIHPRHRKMMYDALDTLSLRAKNTFSVAFLDYLQTGIIAPPENVFIGGMYLYLAEKISPLHIVKL